MNILGNQLFNEDNFQSDNDSLKYIKNLNFRTVEDENPKLKKEISKSKKYDKNIKSDLKTDDIRQGINNEKSFLTEVDITIEQPNSIEKNYEQNFQQTKKFYSKILSK